MCCARCTKNNKCACSVKLSVSDYKDITHVLPPNHLIKLTVDCVFSLPMFIHFLDHLRH